MNILQSRKVKILGIATAWTVALMLAFGACGFAEPPSKAWATKLSAAKATAAKEGKPLLAMLSASWCPPCNYMKQSIFPDASVQKELGKYTLLYVDVDENDEDAKALEVEMMPTFVVFSPQGDEIGRFAQARPKAEEFIGILQKIRQISEHLQALDEKLAASPSNAALWKEKGDVLSENNIMEKGMEAYKKANELDPENKTGVAADIAFFTALNAYDKTPAEGVKALAAVAEKYPSSPRFGDVLYTQGLIAMHDKEMEKAREIFQSYRKKYPKGKSAGKVERLLQIIDEAKKGGAPMDAAAAAENSPPASKPE